MKNDKIISGQIVRKNPEHKGMWDIIETRAGQSTGKVSFTGTMKEVRDANMRGYPSGEDHIYCWLKSGTGPKQAGCGPCGSFPLVSAV